MKGKLIVSAQFILLFALALAPGPTQSSRITSIISLITLLFSLGLIFKSFRDLGEALTVLPESKTGALLVTTGVYSFIRHPVYSALFLLSGSALLWKQNVLTLIWAMLLTLLLIYKAKYEDGILRNKFEQAIEYQNKTPAFFPRLKRKRM